MMKRIIICIIGLTAMCLEASAQIGAGGYATTTTDYLGNVHTTYNRY